MARTVRTRCRSENPKTLQDQVTRAYLTCRMASGKPLLDFLRRYEACWLGVHRYGETGYDGILRLICCLPHQWKNWATQTPKTFIGRRRPIAGRKGNMRGFVFALRNTVRDHPYGPPPVPVAPPLWSSENKRARTEEGESSQIRKGKRICVRTDSEDERDLEDEVERYYLRDADFEAMVDQADEEREVEEEDLEEDPEEDPEEEEHDEAMGDPSADEAIIHFSQEPQFETTSHVSSSKVEELEPPPRPLDPVIYIDNVPTSPQEHPVVIYIDSDDED